MCVCKGGVGAVSAARGSSRKKIKQAFKYQNSSSSGSEDNVLTSFLLNAHQRLVVLCCALSPSICLLLVSPPLLRYLSRYFHETCQKYKPSSDDVQRTRTDTPPTFFMELWPFKIFIVKMSAL